MTCSPAITSPTTSPADRLPEGYLEYERAKR